MTAVVDISWTKKQLQAECRRRGLKGCSALDKDGLIQRLNGTGMCDYMPALQEGRVLLVISKYFNDAPRCCKEQEVQNCSWCCLRRNLQV